MFDIGWGELLIVGAVALIVIGPKELPGVLRGIGQIVAKMRRMAGEFQGQFQEAMREAEFADLKKELDEIRESAASVQDSLDPIAPLPEAVEVQPAPVAKPKPKRKAPAQTKTAEKKPRTLKGKKT